MSDGCEIRYTVNTAAVAAKMPIATIAIPFCIPNPIGLAGAAGVAGADWSLHRWPSQYRCVFAMYGSGYHPAGVFCGVSMPSG